MRTFIKKQKRFSAAVKFEKFENIIHEILGFLAHISFQTTRGRATKQPARSRDGEVSLLASIQQHHHVPSCSNGGFTPLHPENIPIQCVQIHLQQ